MRSLLFVLFLIISVVSFSGNDISYFRKNLDRTISEEKTNVYINAKIEENDFNKKITINAYKGVATMRMAEYVYNPFTKLSWFNKGKKRLEKSIIMNKNVENVHLRLMVQLNAPSVVNYNNEIESDSKYILKNLEKSSLSDSVKKMILVNLIANEKTGKFNSLAKKYGVK